MADTTHQELNDDSQDENPLKKRTSAPTAEQDGFQAGRRSRNFVMTEARKETLAKGRAKRAENIKKLQEEREKKKEEEKQIKKQIRDKVKEEFLQVKEEPPRQTPEEEEPEGRATSEGGLPLRPVPLEQPVHPKAKRVKKKPKRPPTPSSSETETESSSSESDYEVQVRRKAKNRSRREVQHYNQRPSYTPPTIMFV